MANQQNHTIECLKTEVTYWWRQFNELEEMGCIVLAEKASDHWEKAVANLDEALADFGFSF